MPRAIFAMSIVASGLLLAGCETTSVVTSAPVTPDYSATKAGARVAYLPYFLPQSVFVVTVKKAGGGGDKKDAPATVSNTITIQNGKAEVEHAAEAAAPPSKTGCDALKESYNKLRDTQLTFVATWPNQRAALVALKATPLKTSEEQAVATAAYNGLRDAIAASNQRLEDGQRLAKALNEVCPDKITVDVALEVAPDTSASYFMLIEDRALASDKVIAKTDEHGLLTSISTTSEDKTAETFGAALNSFGTFVGVLNPTSLGSFGGMKVPDGLAKTPNFYGTRNLFAEEFIKKVNLLVATAREPERLPDLGDKLPSQPVHFPIRSFLMHTPKPVDNAPPPVAAPSNQATTALLPGTPSIQYYLHVSCSPSPGAMTADDADPPVAAGSATVARAKAAKGVLLSSIRACDVSIGKLKPGGKLDDPETYDDRQRSFVTVLDSRFPVAAPLQRSRFVTRANAYEFKDGRLVSVTYDKPSTAAGAWAAPGAVIGGLFSGLVTAIQGPQGVIKAQANYLDAQASVYTSQAALIEAKTKAEAAAKTAMPAPTASGAPQS